MRQVEVRLEDRDLRGLLRDRGLTVEAVAILAGVDRASVSRWQKGAVRPKPEHVVTLAKALGIGAYTMMRIMDNTRSRQ